MSRVSHRACVRGGETRRSRSEGNCVRHGLGQKGAVEVMSNSGATAFHIRNPILWCVRGTRAIKICMVAWTGAYGHKMNDHSPDESKSYDTHRSIHMRRRHAAHNFVWNLVS